MSRLTKTPVHFYHCDISIAAVPDTLDCHPERPYAQFNGFRTDFRKTAAISTLILPHTHTQDTHTLPYLDQATLVRAPQNCVHLDLELPRLNKIHPTRRYIATGTAADRRCHIHGISAAVTAP